MIPNIYQCTNNTVPRFLHVSYNNRPAEQTFWAHWRRPNVQRTYCVIFDWRMTINADVASIGPILFSFDLEWIETLRFTETVQNISNISHHRRQTFLGRKRSKNVVSSTSQNVERIVTENRVKSVFSTLKVAKVRPFSHLAYNTQEWDFSPEGLARQTELEDH